MLGAESSMDADSAFIATIDDKTSKFYFSSASSHYASTSYLMEEEAVEKIHPCTLIFKVQTHEQDNSK